MRKNLQAVPPIFRLCFRGTNKFVRFGLNLSVRIGRRLFLSAWTPSDGQVPDMTGSKSRPTEGPFHQSLAEAGFEWFSAGLWSRSNPQSFSYSDEAVLEESLRLFLNNQKDVSRRSMELRDRPNGWFWDYHLSDQRGNLLSPFAEAFRGKSVLELGARCGAVSRFIGETGASLLAVEGSAWRSRVLAERVRDLDRVEVLNSPFEDLDVDLRFDFIVIIGVLEYAAVFSAEDNPFGSLIRLAKNYLTKDGTLLLAIENKIGLKYLAGAPEDHLGVPGVGIEGRYRDHDPRTFSKAELRELLRSEGFASARFHLPFPDYKFPASIITDLGARSSSSIPGDVATGVLHHDTQLPKKTNFNLNLVFPNVVAAGLMSELANSFLVEASLEDADTLLGETLAFHYGAPNLSGFWKEKKFSNTPLGIKLESKFSDHYSSHKPEGPQYTRASSAESLVEGAPVKEEIVRRVYHPEWTFTELALELSDFLSKVKAWSESNNFYWGGGSLDSCYVDARLVDAIPRNARQAGYGFGLFDLEWVAPERFPASWLLLRCAQDLFSFMNPWIPAKAVPSFADKEFHLALLFNNLGLTDKSLGLALKREKTFQEFVANSGNR